MIDINKLKLWFNWIVDFAFACGETYMAWRRGDVAGVIDEGEDVIEMFSDILNADEDELMLPGEEDDMDEVCLCDEEGCDEIDCDADDCCIIECECGDDEECWVCCEQDAE